MTGKSQLVEKVASCLGENGIQKGGKQHEMRIGDGTERDLIQVPEMSPFFLKSVSIYLCQVYGM